MPGCLRMPTGDDTVKQVPLAPLATAPPPITARFVNRENAHEISQSLWEEIERDAQGSASWSAEATRAATKE